jgi:hypothetical protein
MTYRVRFSLLLPLLLVVAAGCNTSNTPARVSGKITYKGNPVTAGTITFYRQGDTHGIFYYTIMEDGTYSGADLPAETLDVTIETESANPKSHPQTQYGAKQGAGGKAGADPNEYMKKMQERGAIPGGPANKGPYVQIPLKYNDKAKSGLTVTLGAGRNEKNFELTD